MMCLHKVRKEMNMKKITLSLVKYSDFLGKFVTTVSRGGYNHVSISLDENEEVFYSFNYKGFAIEKQKSKKYQASIYENMHIQIYIPDEIYTVLENEIKQFVENKERYSYTKFGLVLCFLHIPHKFKNKYFCSQFVMELIANAGIVDIKRNESCYLPYHFVDHIHYLFPIKKTVRYIC